jgi:hypothetical protein
LLGLTSTVIPTDCSLKISALDGAWPSSLSGIIHTRYRDFIVNDSAFASLGLGESAFLPSASTIRMGCHNEKQQLDALIPLSISRLQQQ